jgi:predicted metal-binding membrane protein
MDTTTRLRRRPDPGQVAVVGLLLAVSAVAWLTTGHRMAGMDAGPGTDPGALGFYVSVWVVMMAAMMFPSIAPMVSMYAVVDRSRHVKACNDAGRGATSAFVGGYLLTWTAFGLLAYGLYELARSLDVEALAWDRDGPYAAGAVIAVAALYQLTPLKNACLSRCRNPLGFVISSWRDGRFGAVVMGIHHGGWCVGCCWALMAALFALGVMSVAWMVFIALLVAAEKLLPWERAVSGAIAASLLVLAIGVVWDPHNVPGLTLPDSPGAESGMAKAR